MKKLVLLIVTLVIYTLAFSQTDTTSPTPADSISLKPADRNITSPKVSDTTLPRSAKVKKDWSKVNMGNRSGDHFMIQLGYDSWSGKPDTIKTKGLSRSLNVHFMLDFPFKTDPRFSVALGAGVSGSSTFFSKTIIAIAGSGTKLVFKNVADTNYYKKFKLSTTYLEVPLELRFTTDPENYSGSLKFALGAKIGTMINAHIKGKNLLSKSGSTLNSYTFKESSKRFFNSTRLAATARIGYGVFSIFGTYQINAYLKEGAGPDIRPYSIGIALSGL